MSWTVESEHMVCPEMYPAIRPDGRYDVVMVTSSGFGGRTLRSLWDGRSIESRKGWMFGLSALKFDERPEAMKPEVIRERTLLDRIERILPALETMIAFRQETTPKLEDVSGVSWAVTGGDNTVSRDVGL